MLVYLSATFFIFGAILLYRNKSSISTRYLLGIFCGWIISIVAFVGYLSRQYYYWETVKDVFYIGSKTWSTLILYLNINAQHFIRLMNIGVALTFYATLCFGIAFTTKKSNVSRKFYIGLAIIPLLQVIIYDPMIQESIQNIIFYSEYTSFDTYTNNMKLLNNFFKLANIGYCLGMMMRMIDFYIKYPKVKFLKKYTLCHILFVFPIIIIYYFIFQWYPMVLIKPTVVHGYYNYIVPKFNLGLVQSNTFYIGSLIAFILLVIYLYKYSSMESYHQRDKAHINISIDTATLGINTFTHAIKNHIQGIKSEAEYLNQRYEKDEEMRESVRLITQSCEVCFNSIENANKHLKHIDLNLSLQPIGNAVQRAVKVCQEKNPKVNIVYIQATETPLAYIDEEQLSEVLVNLIKNAIDATWHRESGLIEIGIKEQGGWGSIEIKDNGIGISKENINKVFTPFFSTKSSVNNWGVGLAFCYKVITAHDGKLNVESEEGQGAVFSIALPIV